MTSPWLNQQETKELNQFQKIVLQRLWISQLNKFLDKLEWENEKKEAIIEMRESEIECLKYLIKENQKQFDNLKIEFEKLNKKYESVSNQKGKLLIRQRIFPK